MRGGENKKEKTICFLRCGEWERYINNSNRLTLCAGGTAWSPRFWYFLSPSTCALNLAWRPWAFLACLYRLSTSSAIRGRCFLALVGWPDFWRLRFAFSCSLASISQNNLYLASILGSLKAGTPLCDVTVSILSMDVVLSDALSLSIAGKSDPEVEDPGFGS